MPREINDAGYRIIKEFEAGPQLNSKPALVAYRCPAGKLTIGWGHTADVVEGQKCTVKQAERWLDEDLDWAEACVTKYARDPNENEFAAMVLLCFNIGPDPATGFPSSTVLRLHNRGDKTGAAAAFAMWRKMRDPGTGALVDSTGLLRRRNVEADLYLKPVVGPAVQQPMPQAVVAETSAASSKTVIAGSVAVATGAVSAVDQVSQLAPVIDKVTAAGLSMQSFLKLGAPVLSVVAVVAAAYFVWRYIQKKRRGEVIST